ncbi:MAG: BON domain-containing protein [Desulfobulbaceae bacterium]|nr:BON domain-containing protein [Desulfobulbaceae bacterium]
MRKLIHFITGMLLLVAASGCTVYSAAVDERNVKTIASDTKLKLTIEKRFVEDDTVKALNISAFVYDSNAFLTGEYGTDAERRQAIKIAGQVEGVKSVTPYLLAKKNGDPCGLTDNVTLASKVKTALIKDKELWAPNINVEAVQCNIVLLGIVGSKFQVGKAIAHAKAVEGVRDVISYLRVESR